MVIIEAKLYMYRPQSPDRNFYFAGFRASIRVGGIPQICRLSEKGFPNILVEKNIESIEILIMNGEWNLENIKPGARFEIVMGSYVLGKGIINKVLEIYIEKEVIQLRKDNKNFKEELKKLLDMTENLENAIIEEGVVEMLDE